MNILVLCLVFLSMLGCSLGVGPSPEEKWVREKFSSFLKVMPEVPYEKTLGFRPTKEQLELGRMLFNDPILSRNNDVSCATCHLTSHGFADGNRLNFGASGLGGPHGDNVGKRWGEGELSTQRSCDSDGFGFYCSGPMHRNSLSTLDVVFRANRQKDQGLMWDGRFGRLTLTTLLPILTKNEMCGGNPLPSRGNLFAEGGYYFPKPVKVHFSHNSDQFSGSDLLGFYAQPQSIRGIPSFRKNGNLSIPTKNECLAIAVAKLSKVADYKKLFKQAFGSDEINDKFIGKSLAAFVSTHTTKKTPFDNFVKGSSSLSANELLGLSIFMSPTGKEFGHDKLKGRGAGCVQCHSPPLFGGSQFYSLGVLSDKRSALSKAKFIFKERATSVEIPTQRGYYPKCHIENISANERTGYGGDMGRALVTARVEDCFKFRVPSLRNVIESYPYFHHGTEVGQALRAKNFKELSMKSLKRAIQYHLRGAVNHRQWGQLLGNKNYFDWTFNKDSLVPLSFQTFSSEPKPNFPVELNERELNALVQFVAVSLRDPKAVEVGDLGNSLEHPDSVPSGLLPTISRDMGHQAEKIQ